MKEHFEILGSTLERNHQKINHLRGEFEKILKKMVSELSRTKSECGVATQKIDGKIS